MTTPGPGHNSDKSASAMRLKSFVERVERLEGEKKNIADDIKEVFGEAKSAGFDVKIMRVLIRLRKMSKADREEQDSLLQVYMDAIGLE